MATPVTNNRFGFLQTYAKSIVPFLFVLWTVFSPQWFGDKHWDRNEIIIFAVAVGNNLLVYIIPNTPRFKGVKTTINAILMALAVAQTLIIDGLQPDDWTIIGGALLTGLGVTYASSVSYPNSANPVVVPSGVVSG